jgi:hypothetical protein
MVAPQCLKHASRSPGARGAKVAHPLTTGLSGCVMVTTLAGTHHGIPDSNHCETLMLSFKDVLTEAQRGADTCLSKQWEPGFVLISKP